MIVTDEPSVTGFGAADRVTLVTLLISVQPLPYPILSETCASRAPGELTEPQPATWLPGCVAAANAKRAEPMQRLRPSSAVLTSARPPAVPKCTHRLLVVLA